MSNYTKSTNFATKDNLTPGDPLKVVRGTEIDTEYNNIATAIATKTDNASAAITGGTITGITDLAVADGGTGASTATAALNNLLPSQTSNANKYLQTDGTNASWDSISINTGDITGTLAVANGGTGVTSSTGTGSVVLSNSPTLVTPALGTPASGTATNLTGLPISTGVSGLGSGVATFLGTPSSANLASAVTDETGSGALVFANSPTLVTPALGTPSALVGTNITGTASGLTAGNVTTNANLTGAITSVGNATSLGSFSSANLLGALTDETGTGSAVFATSPTLVTPILGTPTSATLTNATGLPIATGVSGLGTGVATALAVNVGSSGAPLVNGGVLGTPSSGTATNLTGLPLTTGVTGTLPTANGGTNLTSFTSGGVVYASSSSALATGSNLTFDGTNLSVTSPSTATTFTLADNGGRNVVLKNSLGTGGAAEVGTTTNHDFYVRAGAGAAGLNSLYLQAGGVTGYQLSYAGLHTWFVGATRTMDLTSTGLGIGTSSPAYKLDVARSGTGFTAKIGNASTATYFYNDGSSTYIGGDSSVNNCMFISAGTNAIGWTTTNGTQKMLLDGSGNLGLGVTPSAFGSYYKAIEISNSAPLALVASGDDSSIATNAYVNNAGTWFFTSTSSYKPTRYAQYLGQHQWHTASAGGTAGNAITFTQAMTLDASGNLGIGTSSPSSKLTVSGSGATLGQFVSSGSASYIEMDNSGGGGYIGTTGNNLVFLTSTGGTERARIDSSGNLLVNTTTTGAYFDGKITSFSPDTYAPFAGKQGSSAASVNVAWNAGTTGDNLFEYFLTETSPTIRGTISYNRAGGLVAYNVTSDYRAKDISGPVTNSGALIDSVPVYMGKMKDATQERPMFLAHETPAYAHTGVKDAVDKDGKPVYQQMDTSALIPVMWAEIQSLRQRLSAANL